MRKIGWTGIRPATTVRALVMALPLLAGACTLVPDWADPTDLFEPDEAPTTVAKGEAPSAGSDSFPTLGSVPDAAPKTTTPATRAVLRETLAADRANAEYSGQKLVAETGNVPVTDAGAAKMPATTAASALPSQVAIPIPKASAAPQVAEAAAEPQMADAAAGSSEPAKSAFRFKQFDTEVAAKPTDTPAARNSELVAIVYFAYGSTALNRDDRDILRDVVALQKQRGGTVRVVGHASARTGIVDSVSHRLANLETSLQRANAVAAQLVRFGVARSNVAAEAKADSQPVYHEFMPTGEAGNRRAEIFLEN